MFMRTKTIISVVLAVSLVAPAMAQAASLTSDQINAVINLLQSFGVSGDTISTVQAVLNGKTPPPHQGGEGEGGDHPSMMIGSTTLSGMSPGQGGGQGCFTLNRNLGPGSQGDDVRQLQGFLAQNASTTGFMGTTTGFFGPATARAMMYYQEHNGIASSSDGHVGPLTRLFFEHRCGMPPPPPQGTTPSATVR
jgi:peptidoglycan hydrolase-like protein with peptidoglycan-binding domain